MLCFVPINVCPAMQQGKWRTLSRQLCTLKVKAKASLRSPGLCVPETSPGPPELFSFPQICVPMSVEFEELLKARENPSEEAQSK